MSEVWGIAYAVMMIVHMIGAIFDKKYCGCKTMWAYEIVILLALIVYWIVR